MSELSEGLTISRLAVGTYVEEKFEVTEELGSRFADVSGDHNPVHLDKEYARKTRFHGKIAHGMLIGSFISGVIGMRLPGEGCIYMKQEMTFTAPVRYGDTITVRVEVIEQNIEKNRVTLSTNCFNQDGKQVIAGKALIMPREEKE